MTSQNLTLEPADQALASLYEQLNSGASLQYALSEAIKRFPAQATLLADAALLSEASIVSTDVSASSRLAINTAMRRVSDRYRPQPIDDLLALIKRRSQSLDIAAQQLRIGKTLLRKLTLRNIWYSSLPKQLIADLADLVCEPIERIDVFFAHAPALASPQSKSPERPIPKMETFDKALQTSRNQNDLSAEDYAYWSDQIRSGVEYGGS